jgi:protein-S-isoprenylcysteine O-methyltransferase Ste14
MGAERKVNPVNAIVGLLGLLLGVALLISAQFLPAGMGNLPGPGYFPSLIGSAIALLSAGVLWTAVRAPEKPKWEGGNFRLMGLAVLLTGGYLLLWGVAPFLVRTPIYLFALMMLGRTRLWSAVVVSIVLTLFTLGAFEYGLRVSLN